MQQLQQQQMLQQQRQQAAARQALMQQQYSGNMPGNMGMMQNGMQQLTQAQFNQMRGPMRPVNLPQHLQAQQAHATQQQMTEQQAHQQQQVCRELPC